MMIPKKIHYCWFGRSPLPESARKCIASWRKYLPDYEIIEWNEDNFDVNSIPYTAQAYGAKKYAFVSDYARFKILHEQGGLYFDTDVEVVRPMDDIIAAGPFMGFEFDPDGKKYKGTVAPGLGLGAEPGMEIYSEILDVYKDLRFLNEDGTPNMKTVVAYITEILDRKGLTAAKGIQHVGGLTIYPKEVFCPKSYEDGELHITPNTRTIHHYDGTWFDRTLQRSFELQKKMKWMYAPIRRRLAVTVALWQVEGFKAVVDQYCESITKRFKKSK